MAATKELIGKKVKGARGEGTIVDIDVKGNIVVDYNGKKFQIYVWMEGTDEACNGANISGDESEYSVSIHLAGVAK